MFFRETLRKQIVSIDHTRSVIGKTVYPLARSLSRKFGHQTITHSLIFYITVMLMVRAIELLYLHTSVFSVLCGYVMPYYRIIFLICVYAREFPSRFFSLSNYLQIYLFGQFFFLMLLVSFL